LSKKMFKTLHSKCSKDDQFRAKTRCTVRAGNRFWEEAMTHQLNHPRTSRLTRLFGAALAPLVLMGGVLISAPAGANSLNVSFSVTSVDFGSETVGTAATAQAVVTNTTGSTLYLKSVVVQGGEAADYSASGANCAGAIASATSCDVAVTFTAGAPGERSSSLNVTLGTKGAGGNFNATATVKGLLSGHGVAPDFTLSDASAGSVVVGSLATASATLTNTSAVPLIVHSWNLADTHHVFSVASSTCPSPLASGASCDFVILFAPKALGNVAATLNVSMSVVGAAHEEFVDHAATVSGTGTKTGGATGPISLSSFNAGEVTVGTSASGQVLLTNVSAGTVTLVSANVVGTNGADFTTGSNNCPANLASGSSCQINVSFTPSQPRVRNGDLAVTVTVTNGSKHHSVKVLSPLSGTGVRPTANLSTPNFGSVTIGSSTSAQVIVTNTSVAPLNFKKATITGSHLPSWSISSSSCSGALAPSASCEIGLTFAPHTQGDLSTVLTVALTIHQGAHTVAVVAQGTVNGVGAVPNFSVTSPAFAATAKGATTSASAVITNTSDVALTLKSDALEGGNVNDFSVTGTTCVGQLAPAASCEVNLTFHPTQSTSGARTSSLRVVLTIAGISPAATVSSLTSVSATES
jgi:hypothetical protein